MQSIKQNIHITVSNFQSEFFFVPTMFSRIEKRISSIACCIFEDMRKAFVFLASLKNRFFYKDGDCSAFLQRKIINKVGEILPGDYSSSLKQSPRENYLNLLSQLRDESLDISSRREMAYHFFRSTELFKTIQDEMRRNLGIYIPNRDFNKIYQNLSEKFPSPLYSVTEDFDPILFGNIPFGWWEYPLKFENEEKQSVLIRMPAATQDRKSGENISVVVVPEFQGYIESLKEKNEKHLYINLMCLNHQNEGVRSKALIEYSLKNPNCVFVSLDKNSSFYKQTGKTENQSTKEFLDSVKHSFQNPFLYYWPTTIPLEEILHIQDQAISFVQSTYAQNSEKKLTVDERRVLIDLIHTEIIHRLLNKIAPSSFNISCKNCIDRGIAQQLELFSRVCPEKRYSNEFLTTTFAPAYLVSHRVMQKDRFIRLAQVLQKQSEC